MPISKVYKHTDTYDTKCKICDKNEIGDEFHYLFIYIISLFAHSETMIVSIEHSKTHSKYKCNNYIQQQHITV